MSSFEEQLSEVELREIQGRAIYFFKKECLRSKINDEQQKRLQSRLRQLTTHGDFRNCTDSAKSRSPARPATTKVKPAAQPASQPVSQPALQPAMPTKSKPAVQDFIDLTDSPSPTKKRKTRRAQTPARTRTPPVVRPVIARPTTASKHTTRFSPTRANPISPTPVMPQTPIIQPAHTLPPATTTTATLLSLPEVTLRRLIDRIFADDDAMVLDGPKCPHLSCEYCRGGLLAQRYALAKRLVQIEHSLYVEH